MPSPSSTAALLNVLDALNLPSHTDAQAARYKEWQHFCVLDGATGLKALFNLNLAGSSNGIVARVLVAAFERDRGWSGDVLTCRKGETRLADRRVSMRLGVAALSFEHGVYHLQLAPSRQAVTADLRLVPTATPLLVRNNTPVGTGHINWLVAPRLIAAGSISVGERDYELQGGQAYHDHNWGRWYWGDDFGWDWGFAILHGAEPGSSWSLVFDRTTDRGRLAIKELTVALWEKEDLARVFTRREVTVRSEGFLRSGDLLKLPRVMALIEPQRTHDIPATFRFEARSGGDTLAATFSAEHAVQVVVPNDCNLQNTIINEVSGQMSVDCLIKGRRLALSGESFFEFVT